MVNKIKGEVALTVEDEVLILVLDVNALVELESLLGEPINDSYPKLGNGNMTVLRAYMWAALHGRQADMDLADAGNVCTAVGAKVSYEKLVETMAASFPAAKKPARGAGGSAGDPPPSAPKDRTD